MRIWVDTDFGFDDLWALLLLQRFNVSVDGVSLVAGNTPLSQVKKNAVASVHTFGFKWPFFAGAAKPLQRSPETAEHILGEHGMCSRGLFLINDNSITAANNKTASGMEAGSAVDAMAQWLNNDAHHHILALGPLSNLGLLLLQHPKVAANIQQITWLGGSRGRGNHSPYAEYNALADPEALSIVTGSIVPFKMIDLELCRQVSFAENHIPTMHGSNRQLVADLLGGYLDIALQRGRTAMSIYDPLAALSVIRPDLFEFAPASINVQLEQRAEYGCTRIDTSATRNTGGFNIAVSVEREKARHLCLTTLIDA